MYGVRVMDGTRIADLKVFRWLSDAQEWMRTHDHGAYDSASIYEVPGAGTRETADAIKRKDPAIIAIEMQESQASIQARDVRQQRREAEKLRKLFGGITRQEIQARLLSEAEQARVAALNAAALRQASEDNPNA